MKNVRIRIGEIGLVYRKQELYDVLTKGNHIINFFLDTVVIKSSDGVLATGNEVNVLLKHSKIKETTKLVEVSDGQICIVYKNGLYETILTSNRYLFLSDLNTYRFELIDITKTDEVTNKEVLKYADNKLASYVRFVEVKAYEESVLLVDGRFERILKAGKYYFYKNSSTIEIRTVDLRMQSLEVSGQEILTSDKANLRLTFNVQYSVVDTMRAVLKNKEHEKQLYLGAQLLLREVVGGMTLDEVLESKQKVTDYVLNELQKTSNVLGLTIYNAGIKDIILPGDMKVIINQVLIAQKKAQANVITRREEVASTRSLLNTAKLLEENSMLYKLKEMEYLEKIAEKVGEITVSGGTDVLKQLKSLF